MKKINKILLELYNDREQLLFLSFLGCISILLNNIIPTDPHVIQASGWILGGVAVAGIGAWAYSTYQAGQSMEMGHDLAQQNMDAQAAIAYKQLQFQKEEAAKLEAQKDVYRNMVFKNPYANVKNQYANLRNPYENLSMENVFEDLTVNQQQAEFERDTMAQQRANIMGQMRTAAGGSGIAVLAQTMANQGQMATRQISASIGQQEAANQRLQAQGAQDVIRRQQAQMAGQGQVDVMIAQGEAAADMARRGGEATLQEMEMSRQATLLGIQMGQTTGANQALQQAYSNQMAAGAAQANLYGQQAAGYYQMGAAGLGMAGSAASAYGYAQSDRKLKKNINKIGESPSGLNIYSFEFKNSKYGKGKFQGVMSDEVPRDAVAVEDGYDVVDYNKLDVEFKQI